MTGTKWSTIVHHPHPTAPSEQLIQPDKPIIKQNPIFFDEDDDLLNIPLKIITATITCPRKIFLSWNPNYVYKVEISGVHIPISSLESVPNCENDRSLPSLSSLHLNQMFDSRSLSFFDSDKQSRTSSEIDEDLFDMSQIPSLPEPQITSHPFTILPEKMIKDLSIRLASSRERNLLTTTLAKSDRFASIPGSSNMHLTGQQIKLKNQSTDMLPILHELDLMLANSRTLNTLKVKVHQAKERLQDSEYMGKSSFIPTQLDGSNMSKPTGRLKRFYNRKRKVCQAVIALLLLFLFLSMLVSLSICCSNNSSNNRTKTN